MMMMVEMAVWSEGCFFAASTSAPGSWKFTLGKTMDELMLKPAGHRPRVLKNSLADVQLHGSRARLDVQTFQVLYFSLEVALVDVKSFVFSIFVPLGRTLGYSLGAASFGWPGSFPLVAANGSPARPSTLSGLRRGIVQAPLYGEKVKGPRRAQEKMKGPGGPRGNKVRKGRWVRCPMSTSGFAARR